MPEGITPQHHAVVFNSMSHVGTYAQQSSLCVAFLVTKKLKSIARDKIKQVDCFGEERRRKVFLGAGAELIALEFEVETAASQAQFTSGARDVAAVFAQGV
jgi:hypothetical protein